MEKQIYDLLIYIKNNAFIPTCEELGISQDRLVSLVRKCNQEHFLDKNYIYVNIMDQIQCDGEADLGITQLGIDYINNNNPVGNVYE